jgi:hypothetical protein
MADVVQTFDLYNTTFYWNGYSVPNFASQLSVAQAYYITQFSSNPVGSQIDFFTALASGTNQNPTFTLTTTIDSLPYLWSRYWWEEAMYYSNTVVLSAISLTYPEYYQQLSESVGTLYYLTRFNNFKNQQTVPYSAVIVPLLVPGVSNSINSFYTVANNLFVTNIAAIGPTGTDTSPNNSNLIMADTDLNRRVTSNLSLTATINNFYPKLYKFLPYNNSIIGNLITPYNWSYTMVYEDDQNTGLTRTVVVDQTNTTVSVQAQLPVSALKV